MAGRRSTTLDNPLKKVVTPGLTGSTGLAALYGTAMGGVPASLGATVFITFLPLAMSDFVFERANDRSELFPVAMGFGVVSGILVFISDSLVGIRAFPNPQRPVRWLSTSRLLAAILTIYYPAQYAMLMWALQPL